MISRKSIYLLFSLIVSVSIFSYLFSNISLHDLIELIKEINLNLLLVFIALSFSMSFFRTWRYALILRSSGYQSSLVALFLIVLVRNFFSDLLPARIGTAIYIYLVNTRLKIPLAAATSSFALAFLFDILALVPLILIALLFVNPASGLSTPVLFGGAIVIGIICLALLYLLPFCFRICAKIAPKIPLLKEKVRSTLEQLSLDTANELTHAKESGIYWQLLCLSLFVRICKYASLLVFLYALMLPLGYLISEIPVAGVFLGICASELSASLPISGIGGFGLYEGTWALTFYLIGFSKEVAQLTAVSHHLFTQVYGYSLGACALLILLLPYFAKNNKNIKMEQAKLTLFSVFCVRLLVSVLLICILSYLLFLLPLKKTSANSVQPQINHQATQKTQPNLINNFPSEILFDSNRSGSFGIYAINVNGTKLRTIVDSTQHEMYPDASPDGTKIVYAKARSTSRIAPATLWLADITGANQKQLIDNGTFPSFSSDGQTIYFERKRKKVMAIKIDGSNEQEVFPADNKEFVAYQVVKPRISPNGNYVAFTSNKKGAWNAWYADLRSQEAYHISSGCEPNWNKAGDKLYFIYKKDTLSGSGIATFDLKSKEIEVFYDKGEPRGHEYFPSIVLKDRFLLFSASPKDQHSHISANYEIFVYDIQQKLAQQITNSSFTNRWPRILKEFGDQ